MLHKFNKCCKKNFQQFFDAWYLCKIFLGLLYEYLQKKNISKHEKLMKNFFLFGKTWVTSFKIKKKIFEHISSYMEDIYKLGLTWSWCGRGLGGGSKSVAPKMDFLRFCARSALLARAKFLSQPLVTYKTFVSDRFSTLLVVRSKNAKVKNGVYPPPLSVFYRFVLARLL